MLENVLESPMYCAQCQDNVKPQLVQGEVHLMAPVSQV